MATRSTTPDKYGLLQSRVRPVGHHASFTLANSDALLVHFPFKDLGPSHSLGAAVARSPIWRAMGGGEEWRPFPLVSPSISRCLLKRSRTIEATSHQHGPGDPCVFVGNGYRSN